MHHPLSHHNISIGNDRFHQMPSDLAKTQGESNLVQKGFYAKEALTLDTKYEHKKPVTMNGELRQLDPRLRTNDYMLGMPNMAV